VEVILFVVLRIRSSGVALGVIIALVSACGEHPRASLTVEVPPGYEGDILVELCEPGEPNLAHIDAKGQGKSGVCAAKDGALDVFYRQGSGQIRFASERITIQTTGDGIPVAVKISRF
jgi:hypothetical protein